MSNVVFLLLTCMLTSNVCTSSALAVPTLSAYKRSFPYTALMGFLFSFILICSGVGYYLIYSLLEDYSVQYAKLMIIVALVGLFSFLGYFIFRALNKEAFYIYEKSYTFLFMFVSCVGVLIYSIVNQVFVNYILSLVFYSLGFVIVNFIVYGAYYKINGPYAPNSLRGLPLLLVLMAIIGFAFAGFEVLI
ncbi:MAG: hypothetical protein IJS68_02225 [Clostridia bacterium]|nr:hypothetical protein [Clostridia bacterium]